uniref:WD_REPEATS_REGION domain-containing protein n=1 Tax=Meloidogyne incognita TaxID=6306 RepID=A0A914LIG0_MELIC
MIFNNQTTLKSSTTNICQQKMRKEIYRYTCEDMLFAAAWSNKIYEDRRFRLVVGTLLDEEKIMNNKDPSQPELFATTSNYLRIFRYHPNRDFNQIPITLECELYSTNKSNIYSAPLTGLDWNEVDSTLLATCSIDTTCTVWNVETVQQIGQVKAIEGSQKTQLIAHEKPVHDIAFAKLDSGGRDQFATAGADGSVRLFDLRSLQHSTILYEDPEKRMLNHVAWNKREHTKLATVAHESFEVVILDIRVPCRPLARFGNHRGFINGIAWAPHSTVHICTAGSDRQALIWQMNHFNRDEPILAYTAEGEINQIHWSNNFHQWISICFNKSMEILRV